MNQRQTTYETISELKSSGHWDFCLATFPKAWTLDFYFRLYELVLCHYPSKPYGYARDLVSNPQIINELGGGIRRLCAIPMSLNRRRCTRRSF